jgi:ABC-type glycerol-3-phosphate transport system substrate-binding protein
MNGIFSALIGVTFLFSPPPLTPSTVSHIFQYYEQQETFFSKAIAHLFPDEKREKNIAPYVRSEQSVLHIWLLEEEEYILQRAIRSFQMSVPNTTFDITTFSDEEQYFTKLRKGFSYNKGPDIFVMKGGWRSDFQRYITEFPNDLFSVRECSLFFWSSSCTPLQKGNKMYAIPLFLNPFIIIVNQNMLKDDRITINNRPGDTWTEFLQNGYRFEKYIPETKRFTALPSENHIFVQLFMTLAHQATEKDPITLGLLEDVLLFLKKIDEISGDKRLFSQEKGNPYDSFLLGKTAVLFGTQKTYKRLQEYYVKAKNPAVKETDVHVFPMPVIQEKDENIISGEIWAMAVSKKSPNKETALAFLAFLSETKNMKGITDITGYIPARKSLTTQSTFHKMAPLLRSHPGKTGTFAFQEKLLENTSALFLKEKTSKEGAENIFPYFSK